MHSKGYTSVHNLHTNTSTTFPRLCHLQFNYAYANTEEEGLVTCSNIRRIRQTEGRHMVVTV